MARYGRVQADDDEETTRFLDNVDATMEDDKKKYYSVHKKSSIADALKSPVYGPILVVTVLCLVIAHFGGSSGGHRQNQAAALTTDEFRMAEQALAEKATTFTTPTTAADAANPAADTPVTTPTTSKKMFLPEKFLEKYKVKHSKQALDAEIARDGQIDPNRKYVLARYQCPERAGNWINYFTWYFIVGMLMDRTVVWQYDPNSDPLDPKRRCDEVLEIADWVPQYDEKIHFGREDVERFKMNGNTKRFFRTGDHADWYKNDAPDFEKMKAVTWFEPHRLTSQGQMWYHDFVVHNDEDTHEFWFYWLGLKDMKEFDRKILQLYDNGHSYLKGMLFTDIVKLKPAVMEAVQPYLQNHNHQDEITIGIHARHHRVGEDASNIRPWEQCLEEMLELLDREDKPCTVYIATDREEAVSLLSEAAEKRNCKAVHVDHDDKKKDLSNLEGEELSFHDHIVLENGAFAGAPFFEDLIMMSSQVRSGFIHTSGYSVGSSASALMWQQLIYNGIQEGTFLHAPLDCSPRLKSVRKHIPA